MSVNLLMQNLWNRILLIVSKWPNPALVAIYYTISFEWIFACCSSKILSPWIWNYIGELIDKNDGSINIHA